MTDTLSALVPMKGHSERIPEKNIREFNGRPLFHWILATLEATPVVDSIVVDTDSETIARGAKENFDVRIIDRPQRLRGGDVPMNDVILHDIKEVDADLFLQTHCTNPLLRSKTIAESVEAFRKNKDRDSLFSVTPLQTRLWTEAGEPINHERDQLLRTQDLSPVYEENSNVFLFTESSMERRGNRIGDRPMMFEMDAKEAVDIDEPIDFRLAEFLHRDRYGVEPAVEDVVDA